MKYCTALQLDGGAIGTIAYHFFSANSIFDPDTTGVGHQPLGHDEWSYFYNHYCVLKSYIRVRCIQTLYSEETNVPYVWGIYLDDDTSAPSVWTTLLEQGRTRAALSGSVAPYKTEVRHSFAARKFFNLRDPNGKSSIGAVMTSSPTDQAYYCIWLQAADETQNVPAMQLIVEIIYYCQLTEPVTIGQS